MPTYAIGDVQGCYDELIELLARIAFDPKRDRVWFTGDLVNRGPKSLQVLRYVRSLGDAAITVLGNHDLHLLALAYSEHEPPKSLDTLNEILAVSDRDELLNWLRYQPLLHYDATLRLALIHAGLPPQWDLVMAQGCARELENTLRDSSRMRELFAHMYGDQPNCWSDGLRGMERLRFITNCFTRLRVCDRDGHLNLKYKGSLSNIPSGSMPWFRAPTRHSRDIRIVFGHWSALGYHDGDGVLALDTGCVWGDRLCAVRLDGGVTRPIFIQSRQPKSLGD
jgi:bis(5'-nucleosyl)-tetraphosphatase (symmetrical)